MFLWVRLVLDSLESAYTPEELRQMIALLPSDLTDLYERITQRICGPRNDPRHARAVGIFRWIAFARRPIKVNELLHGLAHLLGEQNLDVQNIPVPKVLELCKPLVEQRSDGTVGFVHFSIQE